MDIVETMDSSGIRVDQESQKGSVLDVIKMVLGGDSSMANTTFKRLNIDHPELGAHCSQLRINKKGRETPVANAKTLIQIIWLLPGKRAREFRHESSEKVCRLLGGDLSLVSEIEARHASLQSTEKGRASQEFLLSGREEAIESFDDMPAGFRYLSDSDRAEYMKRLLNQQLQANDQKLLESRVELKRKRCDDLVNTYKTMKDLGVLLDDRTLIGLRDNVSVLSRQDLVMNSAVAVAAPLLQDSTTPTHELDAVQRGPETGIVVVSSKLGTRISTKLSGPIGKRMKKLYINKYSLRKDWDGFIKRRAFSNGRPILENVYYERDEDIIEQAIRDVVSGRSTYSRVAIKKTRTLKSQSEHSLPPARRPCVRKLQLLAGGDLFLSYNQASVPPHVLYASCGDVPIWPASRIENQINIAPPGMIHSSDVAHLYVLVARE